MAEVVVDSIPFGEGPVWCPDGTLVVTSVAEGTLYRIWPEEGTKEQIADTGGGANGAALCADGGFLVTQNGGFDFASTGIFENPPPYRTATPGLQRVEPEGEVSYLVDRDLNGPNDLVIASDGTIYFTDPGHYPPPEPPIGRVMAYELDGTLRVVAEGFHYCNGIALDLDDNLVVVERSGLWRLNPDGSREPIIEHLGRGAGDGFCLDTDGRYYVASTIEHGVRVVEDGKEVEFLALDGKGVTTNCCFGGPDNQWLFATDAVPGTVVVWEGMPAPGLPLTPWDGP